MAKVKFVYSMGEMFMPCPSCGGDIIFIENGSIDVNCYTHKSVKVDGLYSLFNGCKNPLCKWSKVKGDSD